MITGATVRGSASPVLGLNKEALAHVYLRQGKPWKAIRVLECQRPAYRPNPMGEIKLLEKIKSEHPEWESMEREETIKPTWWKRMLSVFGLE